MNQGFLSFRFSFKGRLSERTLPFVGLAISLWFLAAGAPNLTLPIAGDSVAFAQSAPGGPSDLTVGSAPTATPTITPNGGSFSSSVSVTLQSATSGASIYYTTNGSAPSQSSLLYTGPITLTSNATLNAKAYKSGLSASSIASAAFSNSGSGNVYYVGTNGNDNYSCSQAQNAGSPKRSVLAGLSCLRGGDTLSIGAGTYDERIVDRIPSGSAGQYTRIVGAGIGKTVLKPSSAYQRHAVISFNSPRSYIEITGITTDSSNVTSGETGMGSLGFSAYESDPHHHFKIIGNEFKDAYCIAVGISGTKDVEFRNNWIHGGVCNVSNLGGNSHQLYMGRGTQRWLVEGNVVEDAKQYGIHLYTGENPPELSDNVIRGNVMRNNGTHSFGAGVIVGGRNNLIYNNIIYNNTGNGVRIAYTGNSGTMVYNNTIYGNSGAGIEHIDGGAAIYRNNIVRNNSGGSIRLLSGDTSSNNLCSHTNTGCTVGDPSFADAANANFHLLPGSQAIDRGMSLNEVPQDFEGNSRPRGTAYDIGAYEY